jgi:hypothetical protein
MSCINKSKKDKKNNESKGLIKEILEKNKMRNVCLITNALMKKIIGSYYFIIHIILIFLGCIVLLFSSNIFYLLILMNIIFIDGVAMLSYHECPLTILEQKYLDTNMSKQSKINLNNSNIFHNCDHIYESQFELIINLCTLLIVKVLSIIILKSLKYTFI